MTQLSNQYTQKIFTILIIILLISQSTLIFGNTNTNISTIELFSDVPQNHYSFENIHSLRQLGITSGVGENKFGFGRTIQRSEFVAFLVKLLKFDKVSNDTETFKDVKSDDWYFPYVETALEHGIIDNNSSFRPNDPITREEIVIMIVNSLGYDTMAKEFNDKNTKFIDVENNKGYILIANELGIINGINDIEFAPLKTAKREEAAAMIMRMYNKLDLKIDSLNGFYAISSYSQIDLSKSFDSLGFGWSSLNYDSDNDNFYIDTVKSKNNDYGIPAQFFTPLNEVKTYDNKKLLMIFGANKVISDDDRLVDKLLSNESQWNLVIEDIINNINLNKYEYDFEFDGIIIDFELLKGKETKNTFSKFLYTLNKKLKEKNKLLYVTVHPPMDNNRSYYDGYDFKTIGEIADKVILMAHDYAATSLNESEMNSGYYYTPLTPINNIYYALSYITSETTGIKDKNKIMLQFSMAGLQWQLKDNKIINKYAYPTSYEKLYQRFQNTDIEIYYSEKYRNPIVKFYTEGDILNTIWYEDERSIKDKIKLANMFGITNFSIWRLGTIPNFESENFYLDIWSVINEYNNK